MAELVECVKQGICITSVSYEENYNIILTRDSKEFFIKASGIAFYKEE